MHEHTHTGLCTFIILLWNCQGIVINITQQRHNIRRIINAIKVKCIIFGVCMFLYLSCIYMSTKIQNK